MIREFRCAVECRADESRQGPGRIVGTLIEAGRVAGDRPEVFAPGSIRWPREGIRLLAEHRGAQVLAFQPVEDGAALRVDELLPDTPLGRAAADGIRDGSRSALSVEFHATEEAQVSGVREVRSAFVDAAALVPSGAYEQARAELRGRTQPGRGRRVWL